MLIGLLLLQNAWTSFHNYRVAGWSFLLFLLVCSTPLLHLFVSDLLFPNKPSDLHDFRETYRSQIKWIAALEIMALVLGSVTDHVLHPLEEKLYLQDLIRGIACILLALLFLPFPIALDNCQGARDERGAARRRGCQPNLDADPGARPSSPDLRRGR
jgi:hypothetical protein